MPKQSNHHGLLIIVSVYACVFIVQLLAQQQAEQMAELQEDQQTLQAEVSAVQQNSIGQHRNNNTK
jgi:uncharacterized protein Veg